MGTETMQLLLHPLLVLLFAAPHEALGADQSCNLTQVRECYSTILDSVVEVLNQQQPEHSLYENLCKKYGTTSQCEADGEACFPSSQAPKHMERLYSIMRQEACGDISFHLLKSLAPTAKCTPLPLIVSCVQNLQLQFGSLTEEKRTACTELEAGLLRCLSAPDVNCPKHRRRATYARKTVATLLETRGCDDANAATAGVQDSSDGDKCWYKNLKRCNERQIKSIRTMMTKRLARNMTAYAKAIAGICRRTRKACHQHSTVESCAAHEQDAIRRLEEAMNEAQALLCKDERALLENLLFSYKWWDIKHFTECSTDIQVYSITDFLYNRPRIHSDCRLLTSRLFRCLNESYAAADEAEPKPDVQGARKVLESFVDRMTCVDAGDLAPVDGSQVASGDATSGPDDTGDADYPDDDARDNATDVNDSAMSIIPRDAESGAADPEIWKPALAGLLSLTVVLTRHLEQS